MRTWILSIGIIGLIMLSLVSAPTEAQVKTNLHSTKVGEGLKGQLNGDGKFDNVKFTESSAPSTPTSGTAVTYVKSDGKLYLKDDAGTETDLTAGSSVSKVGTPVNNQVGVWTGDGTIEGDAAMTFDTATDTLTSGTLNSTSLTASEILGTNAGKDVVSLPVATYPSLAELAFVKGVSSALQTQLGTKAPLASPTFTGTVTLPVGLTGVLRTDTGVVAVDTDVTDIVTASSLTAAGKVELSTTAEIDAGTDTTRAMPVDQFVASKRNIRWLVFNLVEAATDCAAATNIAGDFVSAIAGTILQSDTSPFYLYATNSTAGTTGNMIVDISIGGTSIMTTNKLSFDSLEKTTTTAATPPDLTTTALAVGDIITIDIDSIHTTAAKGLTVYIGVRE